MVMTAVSFLGSDSAAVRRILLSVCEWRDDASTFLAAVSRSTVEWRDDLPPPKV